MSIQTQQEREIIVVGGGLVGCALAAALSRKGLSVTVLERSPAVPEMLRGESVMPAGAAVLEELGLVDELSPVCMKTRGVALHHPAFEGGVCRVDYALAPAPLHLDHETWQPFGLTGWRRPMYETLRAAVRKTPGVELIENFEVASIARAEDRRLVLRDRKGEHPAFVARMVVAADGHGSRVRSLMGFEPFEDLQHTFVQGFVGRAPRYRDAHVHVGVHPFGAAFVFPFPDGYFRSTFEFEAEYRDAVKGPDPLAKHLELLREALPDVWAALGGPDIEVSTPLQVHPGHTVTLAGIVEDGFALIGDAAGCLDPFTGFGMALGLTDAAALTEVLAQAKGDYAARTLRSYERTRQAKLAVRREGTDILAYLFLNKSEGFAEPFAERLGERWRDRDLILPMIAVQFAGYDALIEPSIGMKYHFFGLL